MHFPHAGRIAGIVLAESVETNQNPLQIGSRPKTGSTYTLFRRFTVRSAPTPTEALVRMRSRDLAKSLVILLVVISVVFFASYAKHFFPLENGNLGHDYNYYLPSILAGYFSIVENGFANIPFFTPSFCGGVPFFYNPQSLYFSLPQISSLAINPVHAFLLTTLVFGLIGASAMYLLARKAFSLSLASASFAAVAFLMNGFFIYRMAIGHVTYHGFALLPLLALVALTDNRRDKPSTTKRFPYFLGKAALFALILSYVFYSGGVQILLPMLMALILIWLLHALFQKPSWAFWSVAGAGGLLSVAICAAKLLPALAFASEFERPKVLLLMNDLHEVIGASLISLFVPQLWPSVFDLALPHEYEFGVGLFPLLVIGLAAVVMIKSKIRRFIFREMTQKYKIYILAILIILSFIPIFMNYNGPFFRELFSHIPIINKMYYLTRFWSAYIPLLILLSAICIDFVAVRGTARYALASVGMVLTLVQVWSADTSFYDNQNYNPRPVVDAWRAVSSGSPPPAIKYVGDQGSIAVVPGNEGTTQPRSDSRIPRNDGLVSGTSPFPCYEPIFGYDLEVFPGGNLGDGPVLAESDGLLNLKNPICYVFGEANNCMPGDNFRSDQLELAERFARYLPIEFNAPLWLIWGELRQLGSFRSLPHGNRYVECCRPPCPQKMTRTIVFPSSRKNYEASFSISKP